MPEELAHPSSNWQEWRPNDFASYDEYRQAVEQAKILEYKRERYQEIQETGGFANAIRAKIMESAELKEAADNATAEYDISVRVLYELIDLLPESWKLTVRGSKLDAKFEVWHWTGSEYYERHEVFDEVKEFAGTYLRWDNRGFAELHTSSDTAHSKWVRLEPFNTGGELNFSIKDLELPDAPTWSHSRILPFNDAVARGL